MLKALLPQTNGLTFEKSLAYLQGLKSVRDEAALASAVANVESIRKKRAEVEERVESLRKSLEQAEAQAVDAIAAGRDYDTRALEAAHRTLSAAESQLR